MGFGGRTIPMARRLLRAAVLAVGAMFPITNSAAALDLGFAPGDCSALWLNINRGIITYAGILSDDRIWLSEIERMVPGNFQGKTYSDVLTLVAAADGKLIELPIVGAHSENRGLFAGDAISAFADRGAVTPTTLFLGSAPILVEVAGAVTAASGGRIPVSALFARSELQRPSKANLYGLVDLAIRRLEAIIARHEAGLLTGGAGAGDPAP